MHSTEIGVFLIGQTKVNWKNVLAWLHFIKVQEPKNVIAQIASPSVFGEIDFTTVPQNVEPVASDASALVALAGKRCYNSFEPGLNPNVTKIRTDHAAYIENVLASGHGSVLEHASWTFAIENVSRVFTGEMNRHRAGAAISEGSMRYIRFEDIGYWTPTTIREESDLLEGLLVDDMSADEVQFAKKMTREIFATAFTEMEKWQLDLSNVWKIGELKNFKVKKVLTSMFRRIVGMGLSTGGVWTLNARALRHVIVMRANEHAEEEIFLVFDVIADMIKLQEPNLFGDFERTEKGWVPKYPKV